MRTIRIESSIEELVSRLPALFPYIEWDDYGNAFLHVATDSRYGCYGKVIENIQVPPEVKLISYVPVDFEEIPSYYSWKFSNTIGLYQNINEVFAVAESAYLRKTLSYYYEEVEMNDACVEIDALPAYVGEEALEWVKVAVRDKNGDVIECKEVVVYSYYHKVGRYMYYARKDIIKPCTTYSYRTLISCYYAYKDTVAPGNSFITFMENGIGKIEVSKTVLNVGDEADMIPDFIYLSTVNDLIGKYKKMKEAKQHYENYFLPNGKTSEDLANISITYVRMGGDNMLNWLKQLSDKVSLVANQYLCYAENRDFSVSTTYPIMLSSSSNEIGIYDVLPSLFVSGKRYYHGDVVMYDGRVYVCQLDIWTEGGDNFEYVIINGDLCYVSHDGTLNIQDNVTFIPKDNPLPTTQGDNMEIIVQDEVYYRWDGETYRQINVVSYICGVYDENTETYVFDSQHFVPIDSECFESYNEWYNDGNLYGEKLTYFKDVDFLPSYYIGDYIRFNGDIFEWDGELYVGTTPSIYGEYYTVTENVASKLRELRTFTTYVNVCGEQIEPDMYEDWLYYYKVGTINGLSVSYDKYGNILTEDGYYPAVGVTCCNLLAYGNVISTIEFDESKNEITFSYVIGGHLIATVEEVSTDIDGNPKILFGDFRYDEDLGDGVKFVETYACMDDTIEELYSNGYFEAYVNGDVVTLANYEYERFPFATHPIENEEGDLYIPSEGKMKSLAKLDYDYANTVKRDWLNNILFQPRIKSEISINRGNGASFEKHIRLGEIKTMEDMVESHYFSISEE